MTASKRTDEESTPLFAGEERTLSASSSSETLCEQAAPVAFPWRPVFVILVLNAVLPLAFELVFPFVSE